MPDDRDWRRVDPRSKRALLRLVSMGWPLQVEIEGEPFDIVAQREGGSVYFYLSMRHAVDEAALMDMLGSIIMRNELRELARAGRLDGEGRVLTLDDIIPGSRGSGSDE